MLHLFLFVTSIWSLKLYVLLKYENHMNLSNKVETFKPKISLENQAGYLF